MHHRERTRALIEYRNLLAGTFTRGKRQPAIDSERAVELLRALGYIE